MSCPPLLPLAFSPTSSPSLTPSAVPIAVPRYPSASGLLHLQHDLPPASVLPNPRLWSCHSWSFPFPSASSHTAFHVSTSPHWSPLPLLTWAPGFPHTFGSHLAYYTSTLHSHTIAPNHSDLSPPHPPRTHPQTCADTVRKTPSKSPRSRTPTAPLTHKVGPEGAATGQPHYWCSCHPILV